VGVGFTWPPTVGDPETPEKDDVRMSIGAMNKINDRAAEKLALAMTCPNCRLIQELIGGAL